jgi:hypothetical protein
MAVQAMVNKNLGAILQSRQIIGFVGRFVPSDGVTTRSLCTGHQTEGKRQAENNFFHGYVLRESQ